ncbi:MAG: hypothetical protein KDA17_07095 [Candidatus Saccharibacteria bacterium]|nr:hypothetical protein [Candidatus Saccharibacteria bacterium]
MSRKKQQSEFEQKGRKRSGHKIEASLVVVQPDGTVTLCNVVTRYQVDNTAAIAEVFKRNGCEVIQAK